jgi:hypothetical protein
MSHDYEASGLVAVRQESEAAPAAEGETCKECGALEDVHNVPKRTYIKRKVAEIKAK